MFFAMPVHFWNSGFTSQDIGLGLANNCNRLSSLLVSIIFEMTLHAMDHAMMFN